MRAAAWAALALAACGGRADEAPPPPHKHSGVPDLVIGGSASAPVALADAAAPPDAALAVADAAAPAPIRDEYFVSFGFDGDLPAGVYHASADGGAPTLVEATPHGEQAGVLSDGDDLYISHYFAGSLERRSKTHGHPTMVLTGQTWLDVVIIEPDTLYWYAQKAGEIRKRGKRGGPIVTVASHVPMREFGVHAGVVYYFMGDELGPKRLLSLAPGDKEPVELAHDLGQSPGIGTQGSGVYIYSDGSEQTLPFR